MGERGNWPLDHHAAYGTRTFQGARSPLPADVPPTIGVEPLTASSPTFSENPITDVVKWAVRSPVGRIGLTVLTLGLAGCASKSPEVTPTPTLPPAPTITPIPVGGGDRLICDPQGVIVGKDGKTPATPFPTEDRIREFNSCVLAQKQSAEATATAEAIKKELPRLKEAVSLLGSPQSYRPADPDLNNYYQALEKQGGREEWASPDVKMDSQGNFLSPVYPRETILWELNQIDPKSLPNPLKNAGDFRSSVTNVNHYLVLARGSLAQGDKKQAKDFFLEAEARFALTKFGEVKQLIPQTEEEKRKFGPAGKAFGVSQVWSQPYFRVVELLNSLS